MNGHQLKYLGFPAFTAITAHYSPTFFGHLRPIFLHRRKAEQEFRKVREDIFS